MSFQCCINRWAFLNRISFKHSMTVPNMNKIGIFNDCFHQLPHRDRTVCHEQQLKKAKGLHRIFTSVPRFMIWFLQLLYRLPLLETIFCQSRILVSSSNRCRKAPVINPKTKPPLIVKANVCQKHHKIARMMSLSRRRWTLPRSTPNSNWLMRASTSQFVNKKT